MKFSVSSSEIQKALNVVSGVIPSKSTLPILENFLFELANHQLTITATDLDIAMSVSVKVKGSADGKIAVPAKRLLDTIRALPATEISFSGDSEKNRLAMSTPTGEYKLAGEPSENYPTIPSFKGTEELTIDNESLRRLILKTVFAVSTDELRPSMMGVLFQMSKNEIRGAATDGHRLVRLMNTKLSAGKIQRDVIIPAKALTLVAKSAEGSGSTISFSDTHVKFDLGAVTLVARLIDEKYPSYESVIPVDNDKQLTVDRHQAIASVRRAALYASSSTHQVRFAIKKNSLTISAEDIDFGSEAKETLPCEYSAEPMEIGFNASYIVDILSHIDTDEAVLLLSSPTRAAVVRPAEQQQGENLLMLVMPVRLNS